METKQMNPRQGDSPAISKKEACNPATDGRMPYLPPQVEVIQMENETSVMALSGYGGDNAFSTTKSSHGYTNSATPYNSASSNDLEELINDILTIEQ